MTHCITDFVKGVGPQTHINNLSSSPSTGRKSATISFLTRPLRPVHLSSASDKQLVNVNLKRFTVCYFVVETSNFSYEI